MNWGLEPYDFDELNGRHVGGLDEGTTQPLAATLHLRSGVGSGEVQCWLTGKSGDQKQCDGAQRGEFNGESRGGNVFVHGEVLVFF